jgi:hypothetical protein
MMRTRITIFRAPQEVLVVLALQFAPRTATSQPRDGVADTIAPG